MSKSQLQPGLTLVATPIGNARDITLRALDALREADVLVAEDTRMARRLMDLHAVPLGQRALVAYHDHNAREALPRILGHLEAGARVACVSDAGTPMIADPGYRLAREAVAAGHALHALPGPCAAIMALTLSGLPTDRFAFAGFPPTKTEARRAALREIAGFPGTLVFYESPKRLAASLADMASVFGARDAVVTRELTKLFEEVLRAPLSELAAQYAETGAPRGEIVVLVAPPAAQETSDAEIDAALRDALARLSLKDATREVAEAFGLKRKPVYERALSLKDEG